MEETHFEDPFNIYNLLEKKIQLHHNVLIQSEEDPKYPPGFSPHNSDGLVKEHVSSEHDHTYKTGIKEDVCISVNTPKTNGSMLQLIKDLIKVRQTMGYKMEGCINDIEEIVKKQGEQEFYK